MHDTETIFGCRNITENFNYRQNIVETEREANTFASELLLPQEKINEYLKCGELTIDLVKRIATDFGSSLTSTAFKCVEHSLSENDLLIYYKNKKKSWFVPNGISYLSNYDTPPIGSLADEYFANGTCKESSRVIYGDMWNYEGMLYEGIIGINADEVILLLSARY